MREYIYWKLVDANHRYVAMQHACPVVYIVRIVRNRWLNRGIVSELLVKGILWQSSSQLQNYKIFLLLSNKLGKIYAIVFAE